MKKMACLLLVVLSLPPLVGCGGGGSSSGGGSSTATKEICQACTYSADCKSDRCMPFEHGIWRCVPQGVTTYRCPTGMYMLPAPEDIALGGS